MASLIQNAEAVLTEIASVAVTIQVDEAEIVAGQLVRVSGPAISIGGKGIYLYLSDDPNAADKNVPPA